MGVVWRARDERLGRDVAVKVLHAWVADDPKLRRGFENEATLLAGLQHPHVVRLYDVAQHEGNAVLVLELVEGDSVAALVSGGSRLGWAEAAALCSPVASALAYAHARGVVHRDLTAANVLVEAASGRVVVSDFGLARLLRASSETPRSSGIAGTPEYWSPEQAAGQTPDTATDIYALGCLLFRLVAGRLPFESDDRFAAGLRRVHEEAPALAAHAPRVPKDACALVDSMLARNPRARPTAVEAVRLLGAEGSPMPRRARARRARGPTAATGVASTQAPTAVAPTEAAFPGPNPAGGPKSYRAVRRGRVAAAAFVFAVLVALVGGGVFAIASREPPGVGAPQLVGATLAQARERVGALAEQNDVVPPRVLVTGRAYSERIPAGAVLAQDHSPGEHVPARGTLGVRLSLGSPWAVVPETAGAETRSALDELAAAGFTPVRRYGPSLSTPPWHVAETDPPAGSRVRRPAKVTLLVSTGSPRIAVPDVRGDDRSDGLETLEDAGLAVSVEEVPSASADPGTILELEPAQGTRARIGTTVTVIVAREPRWEIVKSLDGSDGYSTEAILVDSGHRVVLAVDNTSFLGLFPAYVDVSWQGEATGSAEVGSGEDGLLLQPADAPRTVAFTISPDGSAHWTLRIEKLA